MCFYSWEKKRQRQEMDVALFEKIADEVFPRTRYLYLSCATEPLMNKSFASFLDRVGQYRVPFTSFCTNGQLLTEAVVDSAIASGLSEIIFSVDGATAETYEDIRRGGKWDRLLSGLDLLRARKEAAATHKPTARINFTCMNRNVEEMPDLVRVAKRHGITNVHVRHLVAVPTEAAQETFREEMAYRKVYNRISGEASRVADELGVRLLLPDPVPEKPPTARPAAREGRERNPYCLLPWMQAIIKPDGGYQLCSRLPNMGNLRRQSFNEIYHGPELSQIRRRLLRKSPEACSWTCGHEAHAASERPEEPAPGGQAER